MVPFIRHKRGDTLQLICVYRDAAGHPIDLSGLRIKSDAVLGASRHVLKVAITNASKGEFTISASASETGSWPLGGLKCDIKYISGEQVVSSESFQIQLIEQVTNAD